MQRTARMLSLLAALVALTAQAAAQQVYWVFLADKAGTTFDPYTYFDAKALERYQQCGADLYDPSNYPLNEGYVAGVDALATEEVGQSRWLNAMGVVATADQAAQIAALPYVVRVQPLEGEMQLARAEASLDGYAVVDGPLEAQLVRMQGQMFRDRGIDGKGVRIAVFDGGFPRVNTHKAFSHLRDNHQILKTWNFPNRKENVYGWNSHGTMTLSCIGGRIDGKDLGLATGAEYLLARTEVEAEPFKEEVWWQMAVEWADKNGANIISSSLGYGKERHYTRDMDGTSYVARAANLAARKGILVVNSAGNEGDDKQWKTIITPSDADSALCVGGIENSLTEYNHISFSSYGPSADGRQKPNVCAFGYARTANVSNDTATHYVHGTSFSCPLVAGFAACAWQASPGKSAMDMFHAIERSADLYPYHDYAFGYGVPQASYFTAQRQAPTPTFRLVEAGDSVQVVPTGVWRNANLFYSYRTPEGVIIHYGKQNYIYADATTPITFSKAAIYDRTLTVCVDGYTDSIALATESERSRYEGQYPFFYPMFADGAVLGGTSSRFLYDNETSAWGSNNKWSFDVAFLFGLPIATAAAEVAPNWWSPAERLAVRFTRALCKSYRLGFGVEVGNARHNYLKQDWLAAEQGLGVDQIANMSKITRRSINLHEYGVELFQRVRIVPVGITGKGFHWDLGVYANYSTNHYTIKGRLNTDAASEKIRFKGLDQLDAYRWNYGLTTRLTYDWIGAYARYRLNGSDNSMALPRLEIGLQMLF